MSKITGTALLCGCLLLAVAAPASSDTPAGEAAANETDQQFARRMTGRVDRLQRQIEQIEEYVERNRFRMQSRDVQSPTTSGQDDFLRQSRNTARTGNVSDNYRRTKRRLSSLNKKADKERKRLQAPLGSESSATRLDRESVDKQLTKLEHELQDLQRDLYRR
jgi:hypothetical protein